MQRADRLPRGVYLLAVAMAVNTMGFSIVLPYLSVYLYTVQQVPMRWIGTIYAAAGIAGALTMTAAGELTDRFGPRGVMVGSLSLRTLNLAAMGWAVYAHASLFVIGALVVTNVVFRSLFTPAANAAAAALAGPARRIDAFGTLRVGMNLGWVAGPALGGFWLGESYAELFLLATPLTLLAVGVAASVGRGAAPGRPVPLDWRGLLEIRRDRRMLAFLGIAVVQMMLVGQFISTLTVFAKTGLGLHERFIGLIYTVNGAAVVLLQGRVVRAIHSMGRWRALAIGPLAYALGYAMIGWVSGFTGLVVCVLIISLGEMLTLPSQLDAAVELGDPSRTGRTLGLVGLVMSLGTSFGPLVGGFALDHLEDRPRVLWAAIGALGIVTSAGYALLLRRVRMHDKPRAA